MKNKCFIIFLIVAIVSCKKHATNEINSVRKIDSIDFYTKAIYSNKSSNDLKLNYAEKTLRLFEKNNYKDNEYIILKDVCELFYQNLRNDKLNIASKFYLKYSIKNKDSINIANSYSYRGKYFFDELKNDSSFYCFVNAQKIYQIKKDTLSLANVYMMKSKIYLEENDLISSLNASFLALRYLRNTNKYKDLLNVYNSIGSASDELKEHENSIYYYKKALSLIEAQFNGNKHFTASISNNIGFAYQNENNNKEAIKYFEKALEYKELKSEYPSLYASVIDNLSYSKLQLRDFNSLPKQFLEALKIREENSLISGIVFSKLRISEYYSIIKDTNNAKKYSFEALKIAQKSNLTAELLIALKRHAIIDKKNSSIYSDQYIKLSDSIQLAERKNKDRFARIEFETDELRQENTQLSEQNRDILNYFMIAIVFGGFLFFARFQRLKARELALKQTQQQANEEIYRLIISHQNQLEEGRDLEKKRISKELHDGVLGRLFGLRLNLDGLNNFDDDETKQQRLEYLNELKIIEQDLREISHELSRENLVLINNFVAIINNLLEQQTKINNAKINTLISDKIDWEKVSNTIKINLYRILQESLQNINKHAEAKTINVIFNKDSKGNLIFSIEDDGKGYNTNGKKTKGIGVNNIVERVHQCQGKIDIKSQIGKGTKIIITFPLENETINM